MSELAESLHSIVPLPAFITDGEIMPPQPDRDQLPAMYRSSEVSLWLGVSTEALARARRQGSGPPFVVIGSAVLYPEPELLAWARATRLIERPPLRSNPKKMEAA